MTNKKRFFRPIAIFSVAILAAFNVYIRTNECGLTDISLDNVEALAQETNIPDCIPARGFCVINGLTIDHIALE